MNGHDDRGRRTRPVVWLATVVAVLAMAPIAVFTAAAVGRLLQPLPNEPAGTEQRIFDWFAGLPAAGMALAFIVLPVLAMTLAAAVLWGSWRADADLRADARQAVALGGRFLRRPAVWLSAGVVLVGLVLGVGIVIHGIAG